MPTFQAIQVENKIYHYSNRLVNTVDTSELSISPLLLIEIWKKYRRVDNKKKQLVLDKDTNQNQRKNKTKHAIKKWNSLYMYIQCITWSQWTIKGEEKKLCPMDSWKMSDSCVTLRNINYINQRVRGFNGKKRDIY